MPITAPASEVQKKFGSYHDRALTGETVRVTKYGRETVYILSARAFHELKQAQRRAMAVADLSDEELAGIQAAEIPADERYSINSETEDR